MKYYLGIDPGKQGAFVIIDENSNIVEKIGTPLIGKYYDKQGIIDILKSREFHKIGLENPSVIFGIGKSPWPPVIRFIFFIFRQFQGFRMVFVCFHIIA